MVWVALIVLVVVYGGIWWAISRIPTRPPSLPRPSVPPSISSSQVHPSDQPAHYRMRFPDRLKMEIRRER